MQKILDDCRKKFGDAPRTFGWWDEMSYLTIKRPPWCTSSDKLSVFFSLQKEILRHGTLTWCHLVQANQLMFKDVPNNCPGEVVFSLNENPNLLALEQTAHAMYRLKNTKPDDSEKAVIAHRLTDEMERSYDAPVPESISHAPNYFSSVIFFGRHHLPNRKLSLSQFPILVHRKEPRAVMVLPSRYWPQSFVQEWNR